MRRIGVGAVCAALGALGVLGTAGPAQAAVSDHELYSADRCLDGRDGMVIVDDWCRRGEPHQQWTFDGDFRPTGGGSFLIRNRGNGLCIGGGGPAYSAAALVPCDAGDARQLWSTEPLRGNDHSLLRNAATGLYLDGRTTRPAVRPNELGNSVLSWTHPRVR